MKRIGVLMVALVVASAWVHGQTVTLMGPGVNNGSFEAVAVVPDGVNGTISWQYITPAGWNFAPYMEGVPAMQTAGTTGDGSLTISTPDGSQFTTICGGGYLYQSGTCGNFAADTVYTLTGYGARVGHPDNGEPTPELWLASGGLGVGYALPIADDHVFTAFPTITIDTRVDTGVIGMPIEVVCRSVTGNPAGTQTMLDDIVLTATSVPEPASLILLCVGGLFLRRK